MSDRLYIATRKGLFTFDRGRSARTGPKWSVKSVAFLGDPVSMVLQDPRDGAIYAGLKLGHFGCKMHRSRDQGATWKEIGVPAFPPLARIKATNSSTEYDAPAILEMIWALEPGGPDQPGLLWCGTIPGGLFRSRDSGDSWELVRALWDRAERAEWFGGGYDHPGIHSICVDPRDSRHVTVGISCGGAWTTRNADDRWECRAKGMFAEYMPPQLREHPNIQDPHRLVMCPTAPDNMWVQHHNGVFRTTNGAAQWENVANVPPSVFGFAVAVHPNDPDIAWLVPAVKDECRVPVAGKLVVARTRDGGRTFKVLNKGLPQRDAYDIVYRHALEVDETGERLAMGSTTGGLWTSEDGGDTWEASPVRLPPVYAVRFAPGGSSKKPRRKAKSAGAAKPKRKASAKGKAPNRRAASPGRKSSPGRRR